MNLDPRTSARLRSIGMDALHKIKYEDGRYVLKPGRPNFKTCAYPPAAVPDADLCHIVSLRLITLILCDYLNYAEDDLPAALSHLKTTFGSGPLQRIAKYDLLTQKIRPQYQGQQNYSQLMTQIADILNNRRKGDLDREVAAVKKFLSHLNSCPFNLRYPKSAELGVHWNRAVGSSFDPTAWCYLDLQQGLVLSDYTSLTLRQDIATYYNLFRPRYGDPPGTGFYILYGDNGYWLHQLFEMGAYLSGNYDANEFAITSSVENHSPYLASSSNEFRIANPDSLQPFTAPIYYADPFASQWRRFS